VNGSTTSALVSATDITKYQRDGVVVLRNVLTQNVIAKLSDALAQNMQSPGPWANEYAANSQQGRFFDDYVNWSRFDAYKTCALSGVLPQIALALMQKTSGRFFHEHVLVKESGNNQVTPWHNDEPYYGIDSINNVSLWVPLDPIPEKIALRAIAGSHKWGKKFIPRKFVDQSPYVASANEYEPLPDSKQLDVADNIESFAAMPGDLVAFHFRTLHSAPSTTNYPDRRRVVSFRYVDSDAVWSTRPWKTSPPLEPKNLKPGDLLTDERFPLIKTI
jgi:ectoine hydroxylase-related dioxygenase (phytanoyl-CoA dioxygenase family)